MLVGNCSNNLLTNKTQLLSILKCGSIIENNKVEYHGWGTQMIDSIADSGKLGLCS